MEILAKLHDASLLSLALCWSEGLCSIDLKGGPSQPGRFFLVFSGVSNLEVPRSLSWGPSDSVLEAKSPAPGHFEIHMQSGDIIGIHAAACAVEYPGT